MAYHRDLAAFVTSPRPHQCVTSLRVTKSELIGTSQPPRNGIEAREVMETVTVIGSPQAAMAGVTLTEAVAGSSPPSLSSRVILSRTAWSSCPSTAAWRAPAAAAASSTSRVVLELAERNDAEEHGNQDEGHDEDGL